MRYNGYDEGNYNEGIYGRRMRDSRGRYSGEYGARGVKGTGRFSRYRGEDDTMERMEEMKEHYMNYNEGRSQYSRGNYGGGEQEMIESTEGIMQSVVDLVKELAESDNPQVMQVIQKHARKIMEM